MLPELGHPEQIAGPSDPRHQQLSRVEGELVLYGLGASLDDREAAPHVVVSLPGTFGERVYLSRDGGRAVFSWNGDDRQHPVADPAGAARRIATALRREARERHVSAGQDSQLYRDRTRHLATLARRLDDAGHTGTVTEPDGMPVLRIRRPGMADLDVIARPSHGDVDWFRYLRIGGGDITPCDQVGEAAEAVATRLRCPEWVRS